MVEFDTSKPVRLSDWEALLDHGLEKSPSYIIRKNGTTIEAVNGSTGKIDYSGTDASAVIQAAIDALTSGGKIFIRDGTFELTNYLSLRHGVVVEGMGESTVIKQANGANLNYLIYIYLKSASSFGRVQLKNFVLDGNKANQTGGNGYGIYTDTYSSIDGDFISFEDLFIRNTYGVGIETKGNYYELKNIFVDKAGSHGFVIRDYHCRLIGTIARRNIGDGYILRGTGLHTLIGVKSISNDGNGIHLYGIDSSYIRSEIIGGAVMSNDQHGILFEGVSNNRVIGAWIQSNSYGTPNSYDNIHFKSYDNQYSKNNIIEGNNIKAGGSARYQVYEVDSNQDYNLITNNQIIDTGQTGIVVLQGSNSKVKDNIGYITENKGTVSLASGETLDTGLSTIPVYVSLIPKGTVTYEFAWNTINTSSSITVWHTAPSSININWYAEA